MSRLTTILVCCTAIRLTQAAEPFVDVTQQVGLDRLSGGVAAWADFDNDGYLDLVSGARLFRNPAEKNHWPEVRLVGGGAVNASAVRTQVRIRLEDKTLTRQVEGATGQGNQNDLTLHSGLGSHAGPLRLNVR